MEVASSQKLDVGVGVGGGGEVRLGGRRADGAGVVGGRVADVAAVVLYADVHTVLNVPGGVSLDAAYVGTATEAATTV